MANPDDLEQKVLDAADEPKGDYPCPQCSERYFDSEKIRPCFYCSNRFCVKCRERDSDPVTGEIVDICSTCAEKIQEIADQERKIRQQAAEIERLKAFAGEVGYFTFRQIEENVEDGDVKDLLHKLVQTGRELAKKQ